MLFLALGTSLRAGSAGEIPGELLIKYRETVRDQDLRRTTRNARLQIRRYLRTAPMAKAGRLGLVSASTDLQAKHALELLRNDPSVEWVEPNYRYSRQADSNDEFYLSNQLWGVYGDSSTPANPFGSQAAEAWASGFTGSRSVYVAVIDDGIDISHPDLADNIWVNPFDGPDQGPPTDDDGNGYTNDFNGWNFVGDWEAGEESNTVLGSGDFHGTMVAGVIGAVGGNALGRAGINWNVTIIPVRSLAAGTGTILDLVEGIDYCTDLKVRHGLNLVAINASWGGPDYSRFLHEAIIRAAKANILFIAAAGNSGTDNDAQPFWPANIDTTVGTVGETAAIYNNVISVTALDKDGALATFTTGSSSFGASTVHLGAPGKTIVSTYPDGIYHESEGTSLAAPHVTGAVALYRSVFPGATAAAIRTAILASATPTPSLAGITTTGGRLDLGTLVLPVVDTDADGMPDDFEVQYNLDPLDPSDAPRDLDGDALTNLDEFIAGTDPRAANSGLRVTSTSPTVGGFNLAFESVDSVAYALEATDVFPSTIWQTLADNIPGTGASINQLDATAGGVPARIYRIRAKNAGSQSVLSEPVGFHRLTFQGNADTLVSLPFIRPAAELGVILSISGSTAQIRGNPAWTVNQWVYAPGSQTNTYFLFIRGGALEGSYFTITASTADTLTLDDEGGLLGGLAAGDPVAIVPYWTLGSIFPSGEGVNPSLSPSARQTEILFPNVGGSGINLSAARTYYFWNGSWRQVGQGSAIKNDDVVLPDMYLWVRQNTSAGTTLITRGSVITGKLRVPVRRNSGSRQDNMFSLPRPVPASLASSGLIESGAFRSSPSPSSRLDELLVFDNSSAGKNKSATATYYHWNGAWRRVGSGSANMDAVLVFTPGAGVILRAGQAESSAIWVNAPNY